MLQEIFFRTYHLLAEVTFKTSHKTNGQSHNSGAPSCKISTKYFIPPKITRKTKGFLVISGGIEWGHWSLSAIKAVLHDLECHTRIFQTLKLSYIPLKSKISLTFLLRIIVTFLLNHSFAKQKKRSPVVFS